LGIGTGEVTRAAVVDVEQRVAWMSLRFATISFAMFRLPLLIGNPFLPIETTSRSPGDRWQKSWLLHSSRTPTQP
jgi:hypothetical protein